MRVCERCEEKWIKVGPVLLPPPRPLHGPVHGQLPSLSLRTRPGHVPPDVLLGIGGKVFLGQFSLITPFRSQVLVNLGKQASVLPTHFTWERQFSGEY